MLHKDTSWTPGQSVANLERVQVDCGHQSFLSNGHRRLFPVLKRAEREAEYSPPPHTAEVKNLRSYASAPQYFFMSRCLTTHRDGFIYLQALTSLVDHGLIFRVMTPYERVGVCRRYGRTCCLRLQGAREFLGRVLKLCIYKLHFLPTHFDPLTVGSIFL